MASSVLQLELEEGEIDEDDEKMGSRRVRAARRPTTTGGTENALTTNAKVVAVKLPSFDSSEDGVTIQPKRDELINNNRGDDDDDDDCVVTYEKPAAAAVRPVSIKPFVRRHVPHEKNRVQKTQVGPPPSLLTDTCKAATGSTNKKRAVAIRNTAQTNKKTQESPNYRPRVRLREQPTTRKIYGTPPSTHMATASRGFYRSKFSATQPWRSRTRISMPGRARTPSKGVQHKTRSMAREKPSSTLSSSHSSVDPSYEDLLAQYRRIQLQLEDLGKEDEDEENTADMPFTEIDEDQKSGVVTPATTADVNKENLISDNEYIELHAADVKKNDKIARWDKLTPRRRMSSRSSSGHKNLSSKAKVQNKDEDDDELELRRIALASAFHRTPRKGLSENIGRLSGSLGKNHEELNNLEVTPPESLASAATVVICARESKERKSNTGDDEDEDILRAMLLSSLSNKQLEKNTRLGNTPALQPAIFGADETSLDSVSQQKPTMTPTKTLSSVFVAPPLPKHDPVVISLKDDTDSEPEDRSVSQDVSLFNTIDSFLTEVRQKVDQSKQEKQVDVPKTPSAVLSLPSPDLQEYRRLKAEIEKRERFISKGGPRQLPTETITVTVPQHSAKQKTIVVRHTSSETSSIQARLKDCESKLQRHSQEMLDSQRELQRFKLHVNAKEAVINSAYLKISKLKEQLAAAEKVAAAQRANFESVKRRHDDLSKHIESMQMEKQKLQNECLAYGKRLYGESFQVPQSFRIVGVKRKSISFSNTAQSGKRKKPEPQRKVLQPSGPKRLKVNNSEMIRLKAMEQEIALKLQELRRKANNTLAANTENNKVVTSANQSPSNVQRRRRSFLEKNQSTKPQIHQVTTGSTGVAAKSRDSDQLTEVAANATAASASTIRFTDAQLQAAKRLMFESVNNVFSNRINGQTLNPYEMHIVLHCRTENVTGLKIAENRNLTEVVELGEPISAIGPYTSLLLHCRTYRFSPYFRNKANQCLTWPTHMHKLSPKRILCRFELTGTCNDDECLGQHIRDYTMTAKEALCDIVSFCPRLANVSDGATVEECKLKIEAYVEKLQSSNSDRMTHDQLCILTVGRVNEALGKAPPHYITFEERQWRPGIDSDDSFDLEYEPIANRKKNIFSRGSHCEDIPDEVVGEGDARYFSTSAEAADALEFAVLKSPTDANLWLRLAYKKLDGRGRSADVSLDMALNVLSRGLEENLHNKDLWLHYLGLYSRRKEQEDLLSLCEQAVGFCPCYEVWWKYLQEIRSFTSKRETCKSMLKFVLKSDVDLDIKSRQILEVLLYDVQLNVLSGRFNDGKKILELCVLEQKTTNETDLFRSLVDVHKCVLWLCYIHMVEFHCLPDSLFDPANSGPGRIVCTTPFLLPWSQGRNFRTSVSHVRKLFMVALRKCVRKGQSATANAQVCLPLYRNLTALEICRNKHQLAVNICRQLLETAPTQEVFIVLAGMFYRQKDFTAVRQTLDEAIKVSPSSPLLHYFAASYELSAGNAQDACDCVSRYLATFFDLPDENQPEGEIDRVEEMFSQLLGLTVAPSSTIYTLKISKSEVNKRKPYLWLSYCIWLEALGRHTDVVEAYEAAILQMLSIVDLQIVWLRYLQYALQQIVISSAPTTERDFSRYTSLVHRCLTSVLCLAPFPEAERRRLWSDYSFFNKIVDSYVNVLHESQRIDAYQSFCSLAPENTVLALRLLQLYLDAGQHREAWSLVKNQLEHSPHSWDLWKVAIYLAKRTKRISVVRLLFEDALNALPFNIQVWRQFIVSELADDRTENAERLLNRSRQSGIAVDDILKD